MYSYYIIIVSMGLLRISHDDSAAARPERNRFPPDWIALSRVGFWRTEYTTFRRNLSNELLFFPWVGNDKILLKKKKTHWIAEFVRFTHFDIPTYTLLPNLLPFVMFNTKNWRNGTSAEHSLQLSSSSVAVHISPFWQTYYVERLPRTESLRDTRDHGVGWVKISCCCKVHNKCVNDVSNDICDLLVCSFWLDNFFLQMLIISNLRSLSYRSTTSSVVPSSINGKAKMKRKT